MAVGNRNFANKFTTLICPLICSLIVCPLICSLIVLRSIVDCGNMRHGVPRISSAVMSQCLYHNDIVDSVIMQLASEPLQWDSFGLGSLKASLTVVLSRKCM